GGRRQGGEVGRGERQLTNDGARRRQRGGDGVRRGGGRGHDAALAGTFGAERIRRGRRVLQRDAFDVRKVGGARQRVVGERAGQQLPCLVVDERFDERAAESLHGRA